MPLRVLRASKMHSLANGWRVSLRMQRLLALASSMRVGAITGLVQNVILICDIFKTPVCDNCTSNPSLLSG